MKISILTLIWQKWIKKELENYGLNDLRIIYKKPVDKFIKPLEFFSKALANRKPKAKIEEDNDEQEENQEEETNEEEKGNADDDFINMDIDTEQVR